MLILFCVLIFIAVGVGVAAGAFSSYCLEQDRYGLAYIIAIGGYILGSAIGLIGVFLVT